MATPSPSRIIILGVFVEVFLAAIGAFLIMQIQSGAIQSMTTPGELITRITTVLGAVMGFMLVIFILRYRAVVKAKRNG